MTSGFMPLVIFGFLTEPYYCFMLLVGKNIIEFSELNLPFCFAVKKQAVMLSNVILEA